MGTASGRGCEACPHPICPSVYQADLQMQILSKRTTQARQGTLKLKLPCRAPLACRKTHRNIFKDEHVFKACLVSDEAEN